MIAAADIRKSMRINNTSLDDDIQRNIDACRLDMKRVGIDIVKMDDALMDKACEIYCKWQFNYAGKGEQYEKNYNSLRDSLSLSGDYNVRYTN